MPLKSSSHSGRCFLFLQGPHGPFFQELGQALERSGARVIRIGFNSGDAWMWKKARYIAFRQSADMFEETVCRTIDEYRVTDLVCYGSSRQIHQTGMAEAKKRGLTVHVFEEGYLRPYWVTYERGGTNAASPSNALSLDDMALALDTNAPPPRPAPAQWGDLRSHIFWGAVYHAALLSNRNAYPGYRPHRAPDVVGEFRLHLRKLATTPSRALLSYVTTKRVLAAGFPYHLVLLQLAHDANFLENGPFPNQESFLRTVFRGFVDGAPSHHHLVLKAHPLEDGREPLRDLVRRLETEFGLKGRVHFIPGGKLANLLDASRSAVTVNSTAGEQALWRGLPVLAFGRATYVRDSLVSKQTTSEFFSNPEKPDHAAYMMYRSFLLSSSQIPGGFYGFRSRHRLLRDIPDLMLAEKSPYQQLIAHKNAASRQHLSVVG